MWEWEVPLSSREPSALNLSSAEKGGLAGVVSRWASPVTGDDERLLVADGGEEQSVGGDLGGGVEPDGMAVDVGKVDGVVEGAGGWKLGDEGDAGADEDGVGVDARGAEHGDEQRRFVLAVAVLVVEDVAGLMRLIAADTEGHADVTDLGADEVVDGAGLVFRSRLASDEGGDAGANVVVGGGAGAFEGAVPGTDLGPGMEVGPGDVRWRWIVAGAERGVVFQA